MEKSCQPQTEQMCNPPKKQPTQEKVHQVDREVLKQLYLKQTIQQLNHLQALLTVCGRWFENFPGKVSAPRRQGEHARINSPNTNLLRIENELSFLFYNKSSFSVLEASLIPNVSHANVNLYIYSYL